MLAGLMSPVEDAFLVGGVEGVSKLNPDFNGARNGKRAKGYELVEGLAFEQLHSDESAAIVFLDGVNGADARMIGARKRRGLREGNAREFADRGACLQGEFQGDAAAEFGVFGFRKRCPCRLAELAEDAVVRDGFVEHRREVKRGW